MITTITAKFPAFCSISGAPILPGDCIRYDTVSRRVWLAEPGDLGITPATKRPRKAPEQDHSDTPEAWATWASVTA